MIEQGVNKFPARGFGTACDFFYERIEQFTIGGKKIIESVIYGSYSIFLPDNPLIRLVMMKQYRIGAHFHL